MKVIFVEDWKLNVTKVESVNSGQWHDLYTYRLFDSLGDSFKSITLGWKCNMWLKVLVQFFYSVLCNEANFYLPTCGIFVTLYHKSGLTYLPQRRYVIIEWPLSSN